MNSKEKDILDWEFEELLRQFVLGYNAEYDLCNSCYEDILKYAKEKGGKK